MPGREAENSASPSVEVKNQWSFTAISHTPQYSVQRQLHPYLYSDSQMTNQNEYFKYRTLRAQTVVLIEVVSVVATGIK